MARVTMNIKAVTEDYIEFSNGKRITFDHEQDCCEHNYADFSVLNENNINYGYDFSVDLEFRYIDEIGFIFGSEGHWIVIPCYSVQNGYYTTAIDIYYDGKQVLSGSCIEVVYL